MIRKCLAAQKSVCTECNCACPSCGIRKYSVNEDCQLCRDCEEKELKRANVTIDDLRSSIVIKEENPAIILFGGK
jgi:hypothetical protein